MTLIKILHSDKIYDTCNNTKSPFNTHISCYSRNIFL